MAGTSLMRLLAAWRGDADGKRGGRPRPGEDLIREFGVLGHYLLAELGTYFRPDYGVFGDLDTLGAPTAADQFIVSTAAGAFAYESGSTARGSLGWRTAVKTGNTDRTSTTLTDDPHLTLALEENSYYALSMVGVAEAASGTTTPDIEFGWASSNVTARWHVQDNESLTPHILLHELNTAILQLDANGRLFRVFGFVYTGAGAATLTFRWARDGGSGTTRLAQGSYLECRKLN